MTTREPTILALDTSTEMCSAALRFKGEVRQCDAMTQRGHSEKILAMMDSLLLQADCDIADVDILAFGRGPGSFTGVRIAVGVAQGVAFARELPVAAVSTLAAIAQTAIDRHGVDRVAVAMDARMGEVYAAHFRAENGLAVVCDDERVCHPHQFRPLDDARWCAAGSGWHTYRDTLMANFGERVAFHDADCYPQAAAIIRLARHMAANGELVPAHQAAPVYLRDNVAKKKAEQA